MFNSKKWKYKQKSIPIEFDYDKAKNYAKEMFKRLINDRSILLEGIAVSKMPDNEVTSKELHMREYYIEVAGAEVAKEESGDR